MTDQKPRQSHCWRFRQATFRQLLLSHGWGMKGAYALKSIHGKEVAIWTVADDGKYISAKLAFSRDIALRGRQQQRSPEPATAQTAASEQPSKKSERDRSIPMTLIDMEMAKAFGFM